MFSSGKIEIGFVSMFVLILLIMFLIITPGRSDAQSAHQGLPPGMLRFPVELSEPGPEMTETVKTGQTDDNAIKTENVNVEGVNENSDVNRDLVDSLTECLQKKKEQMAAREATESELLRFIEDDDEPQIFTDKAIKRSWDVEYHQVYLDWNYYYRSYKNSSSNVYNSMPFLIRIDTGKDTELRFSSDFITYQDPILAINDLNVGYKWHIKQSNPSIGILLNVELPTAGGGVGDPGIEPSLFFLLDFKMGKKWDLSMNLGGGYLRDGTSLQYYIQWQPAFELDYRINKKYTLGLAYVTKLPNAYPNGQNLGALYLCLYHNPRKNFQYNFIIGKGLSGIDRDWVGSFGISTSL